MGWIRRSILLIVGALCLTAANSPRQSAHHENPQTEQVIANSLQNIEAILQDSNKRDVGDPSCNKGQDNRKSDLCAQWKAADASQQSAEYAFWFGIIGAVVGGSTLIAAVAAAVFARKAAVETAKGAKAAKKAVKAGRAANSITNETHRAWIGLEAVPNLIQQSGVDGLYIRADFVAKNFGSTAAKEFDFCCAVIFRGQTEKSESVNSRIQEKIEEWKSEYTDLEFSTLPPNVSETISLWESFDAEEIKWWEGMSLMTKGAQPILLSAVFYRTTNKPKLIQLSWKSWHINWIDTDGLRESIIPLSRLPLYEARLYADPFHVSVAHTEYADDTASQPT